MASAAGDPIPGERQIAVLERVVKCGLMPPLCRRDEDEAYRVLDGEVTFFVGEVTVSAEPGDVVVAPSGAARTFRVDSASARWVVMTRVSALDRFQDFARAVGRPSGSPSREWRSVEEERAVAGLAGLFGLVALLLAAVGLYGVTAYTVAQRTQEIGIRMALGADRGNVVQLVLRGAGKRVLLGLALGVPLAIGAGRLISAQLYGVSSCDPFALIVAASALAIAAFVAAIPVGHNDPTGLRLIVSGFAIFCGEVIAVARVAFDQGDYRIKRNIHHGNHSL